MTTALLRAAALGALFLQASAPAQRNPGYLQYQFNEPRGTQTANTGGSGPSTATAATPTWQASAAPTFGPADPGIGALGIDDTAPYENTFDTGWPLNLRGSFTISWRQRMVSAPGTTLAYAWGSGVQMRCFTGGVAGNRLVFRGTVLGDVYTSASVQVGGWQTIFLVVDDARRTVTWYIGTRPDSTQSYPSSVSSFSISEGSSFQIGKHTSTISVYTRFFEMDDFRFYSRALDQLGVHEEIGNENPTAATFDRGCAGSYGPMFIDLTGEVNISRWNYSPATIRLNRMEPGRPGILVLGLSAVRIGGLPLLPLDISAALGTPGCTLGVSPDVLAPFSTAGGNFSFTTYLGGLPIASGTHLYIQAIVLGRVDGYASAVLDLNLQNDT